MDHHAAVVWIKSHVLDAASQYSKCHGDFTGANMVSDSGDAGWGWARAKVIEGSIEELIAYAAALKEDKNTKVRNMVVMVCDDESAHNGSNLEILPQWLYGEPKKAPPKPSASVRKYGASPKNSLKSAPKPASAQPTSKTPNILAANSCESFDTSSDATIDSTDPNFPPDDLIELTHLHEPALVYSLKKRFRAEQIYTSTGQILLALNPFKYLEETYEEHIMDKYREHGQLGGTGGGTDSSVLPPHVFGAADASFRAMMRGLENAESASMGKSDRRLQRKPAASSGLPPVDQSVLVSGESGAGKTVTTKHIMAYLASGSRRSSFSRNSMFAKKSSKGKSMRRMTRDSSFNPGAVVEQKILESNPILEAFGNARTVRNDNSSRFGKYIELQFTTSGKLMGASIETYLLERVRLVHQMPEERNYHIFYEMLDSATEEERERYRLDDMDAADFKMTNMSGTFDRRDGVDDCDEFDSLVVAMGTMGFTNDDQADILKVVSATLHSSNLMFESISDDECRLDPENPHVNAVVDLLGFTYENFNRSLCYFEIQVGKEKHLRSLPRPKAEKGLEALVKSMYGSLFDYIVQRVNKSIMSKSNGAASDVKKAASIGILDIFGFESFITNSFEQLCINYCNEALQQQFNQFVFKSEQEDYKKEGINWSFIEFPDNQDVLDLIDQKGKGIIAVLDEKCRWPKATDATFADALYQSCKGSARFEATLRQQGSKKFGVHHYAGTVEYETDGFLEKNKDELPKESTELLLSSTNPFVKALAKSLSKNQGTATQGSRRGGKAMKSVGNQFTAQLKSLRQRIDSTSPHFVRCLKPNSLLVPDNFDSKMIADQLKYAGVLEAVRVSRVGFPQRYSHMAFAHRYRLVAVGKKESVSLDSKAQCSAIIQKAMAEMEKVKDSPLDDDEKHGIQIGNTKIFLKQNAFDQLERLRLHILTRSVVVIQAAARRRVCMVKYRRIISTIKIQATARKFLCMIQLKRALIALVYLQCCVRRYFAMKELQHLRKTQASDKISSCWRGSKQRRTFGAILVVALWTQRLQRGRLARREYAGKLKAKRLKDAERAKEAATKRAAMEQEAALAREAVLREAALAREREARAKVEAERLKLEEQKAEAERRAKIERESALAREAALKEAEEIKQKALAEAAALKETKEIKRNALAEAAALKRKSLGHSVNGSSKMNFRRDDLHADGDPSALRDEIKDLKEELSDLKSTLGSLLLAMNDVVKSESPGQSETRDAATEKIGKIAREMSDRSLVSRRKSEVVVTGDERRPKQPGLTCSWAPFIRTFMGNLES